MKLLYDSSLLGIGYRNQTISGLMRSAESLLLSIVESDRVNVTLCGSLSFEVWQNCRKYMNQTPSIARLDFVRQEMTRNNVYQKLSVLINNIEGNKLKHHGFFKKLLRKLFEINFNPLLVSNLNGIDIYHSPYHNPPKIVSQTQHIKCFLTVHDIIPVLHPELFGLRRDFTTTDFDKEFNLLHTLESLDRETWIICPSRSTKDDLCNYLNNKIDVEKIIVIPWAASTLFYCCRDFRITTSMKRKYGIPEGRYILSLSTLEPRKNIVHLIRCFAQLVEQENLPDLFLVLAGSLGWNYEPIFQEIAKFNKLKERIIFTGYVADEDMAPLYSDALVFVYPSLYEGFGLPPLEAMQCGAPVIASNTSSLPEVIGNAGMMLDPLDRDGLCQGILNIYHDTSLRKELSISSIKQAQRFSWSMCAQQTVAAYRKALTLRPANQSGYPV